MAFAQETKVPVERSKAEIEFILKRYGATHFMYGTGPRGAVIAFEANGLKIKMRIPLPDIKEFEFTKSGNAWGQKAQEAALEKECRRRWRALVLVVKAKLEGVASGITEFNQEFLPYTMLPDGQTVAEWVGPQIQTAYLKGEMPPLLGMGS
jgi:hypothetical protein